MNEAFIKSLTNNFLIEKIVKNDEHGALMLKELMHRFLRETHKSDRIEKEFEEFIDKYINQ